MIGGLQQKDWGDLYVKLLLFLPYLLRVKN